MTRSLAVRVAMGEFDPVVGALALRMCNDPKQAAEVVTGVCHWPPPDGEDPYVLAVRAADMRDDLIYLRDECGHSVSQFRLDQLEAAELALIAIGEDEDQERRLERWAHDERPYVPA